MIKSVTYVLGHPVHVINRKCFIAEYGIYFGFIYFHSCFALLKILKILSHSCNKFYIHQQSIEYPLFIHCNILYLFMFHLPRHHGSFITHLFMKVELCRLSDNDVVYHCLNSIACFIQSLP
jgi:hypothetical protein